MMADLWIIERRDSAGGLDFGGAQPELVFGRRAITGITEDEIAKTVFRHKDDATMTGDSIAKWPALIDPMWVARRKTW